MTGHLFLVKVDRSLIGQLPVIIGQKVGTSSTSQNDSFNVKDYFNTK
jgi:hypothetical protein